MSALKKIQKWIEAINNYYAFALLVYAAALYITSHNYLFFWIFVIVTPLLAGWTGYLLKGYLDQRNQRHGFQILSDVVSYEIGANRRYTLHHSTKIQAGTDHLMVYPIGHRWTGSGEGDTPKITSKGQQLLTPIKNNKRKASPYKVMTTDGEWQFWFVALNPPVHKGDTVEIKYSRNFYDKKSLAKPHVRYFVRVPPKRIELNVRFPKDALPKNVTSSFIKPSDPSRPHIKNDVLYDPVKQWATWVIEKPKRGYCYQITWQ